MERYQLEHALRAAKEITGEREFIVIGAGCIFASVPHPSPALTATQEADLYPRFHPEKAVQLNCIGEMSPFHSTHGFYVDPVGPETAKLPAGWQERLIKLSNENTNQAIGWCLEIHDLAVSKLLAGRDKDLTFIEELFKNKLISFETVKERLALVRQVEAPLLRIAKDRLDQINKQFSPLDVDVEFRQFPEGTKDDRGYHPNRGNDVDLGR